MRSFLVVVVSMLTAVSALASGQKNKTPISDAELLAQVEMVRDEINTYSHKDRAERAAYRLLRFTAFEANNNFCPVGFVQDPQDSDLLDLLEVIEEGVFNNTHDYRTTKKISNRLERALNKLETRRIVDVIDVAELTFGAEDELDLGQVGIFGASNDVVVITNSGTQTASGISIVNPSAPFSIAGGSCSGITMLAAGESCTLDVTFSPESTGLFESSIIVNYNNTQTSASAIKILTGEGI